MKSRTSPNWTVQSRSENSLGSAYWQEEILNFAPAANPAKTGDGCVVGCGKENSLAFKSFQVAEGVVDQVVGVQDAFVSAENEVGWRDKGEVTP